MGIHPRNCRVNAANTQTPISRAWRSDALLQTPRYPYEAISILTSVEKVPAFWHSTPHLRADVVKNVQDVRLGRRINVRPFLNAGNLLIERVGMTQQHTSSCLECLIDSIPIDDYLIGGGSIFNIEDYVPASTSLIQARGFMATFARVVPGMLGQGVYK